MFEGTITLSPNPLATIGDDYSRTFSPVFIPGKEGYRGFTKEDRADGNFWRCGFLLTGSINFLKNTMANDLSKMILVTDEENQDLWEGLVYEMELNTGVALYRTSLADMFNHVKIRYRITGAGTPTISTPLENAVSQARFGIREYVMTGGELENAIVADQPVQRFLDMHHTPKIPPVQLGLAGRRSDHQIKGVTDRPHIMVKCRGFDDTLDWQIYEHDVAGNQAVSAQIKDILDAKAQFVASYTLQANSTSVSTQYKTDRRSGGIIRDCTRLGGPGPERFIEGFTFNRHFVYESAAPARLRSN
jgi:hypothetical protein